MADDGLIVIDDPRESVFCESDIRKAFAAYEWFKDAQHRIAVQSRIHAEDLIGYLAREVEWEPLVLPADYLSITNYVDSLMNQIVQSSGVPAHVLRGDVADEPVIVGGQ